jgi:plastocyanin
VTVVAKGIKWENERLTAQAGRVRFYLQNKDTVLHNFDLKTVGTVSMPARKAASGNGDVKAGTYEFVCDFHPDTMKGTLTVT